MVNKTKPLVKVSFSLNKINELFREIKHLIGYRHFLTDPCSLINVYMSVSRVTKVFRSFIFRQRLTFRHF